MFETGLCRSDSKQCKILTGYPIENCRLYITFQTTGDAVHFSVDSKVEINWGDDEWITYEAGVIIGYQLFPEIKTPVEVRGVDVATKLYFGNRASTDYTYTSIDILLALDLEDAERMCYNLGELESFSFNKSNNVKSFKSSWERCCKLRFFNGLDISDALTIEKAWKDCSSLQTMIGLYSDKVLTAEEAFYRCGMMSNYSDIILESCTNWRRTFGYNTNLQVMNYLDTSEGTDFGEMFHYSRQLKCIMAVDTLKKETTWNMFLGCNALEAPNPQQQTLILNGYEWEQGRPCDDEEPCNGVYCENFNVYNLETHEYDRMVVIGGYPYMVGLNHFGCNGENPPITQPDFGYTCEVDIDCPDCATFKVFQGFGLGFDNFIFADGGEYHISTNYHGSCTGGIDPDLPFGYTCHVGSDCPSCVICNVLNSNGDGFEPYSPEASDHYMISDVHGNCGIDVPPVTPDYGFTCTPGTDCPGCVTFKVFNSVTGLFDTYIISGYNYQVGWEHGGCVADVPPVLPDYGLQCTVGVDCPDCVTFNTFDGYDGFEPLKPQGSDLYAVGVVHGGCTEDVPPVMPDYGLQCTIGVDCPDCVDFMVLNATEDGFDGTILQDGWMKVGVVHGGCTIDIPKPPSSFSASNDEVNQVTLTWFASPTSDPAVSYRVFRDFVEIVDEITGLTYTDVVGEGTYTYAVEAYNINGDSSSKYATGTSLEDIGERIPPSVPANMWASDKYKGSVVVMADESTGNPVPTYDLYENDILVMTDMLPNGTSRYVSAGTRDYFIRAINSEGTADSATVSGTSLSIAYDQFNVSIDGAAGHDKFITAGEPFTVLPA